MATLFDFNLIVLLIALLIGTLIGWWMFKGNRKGGASDAGRTQDVASTFAPPPVTRSDEAAAPPPPRPAALDAARDTGEGNSLADQGAAAVGDVAGELLGAEVHAELPGAEGPPDDLQMMKGVGPRMIQKLNENGFTRFAQLARLSSEEAEALEDKLGPFKGRLARDRVVEQASYLARGDRDGFEKRFGNLGSGGAPFAS
jgi:predicted flap endonuclease-1-like 5' DNA nuclease